MRLLIIAVLCIAILGCSMKGFEPTDEDNLKIGIRKDFMDEHRRVLSRNYHGEWYITNWTVSEKPRAHYATLTKVVRRVQNVGFRISHDGKINDVFFGDANFYKRPPVWKVEVARRQSQPADERTTEDAAVLQHRLDRADMEFDMLSLEFSSLLRRAIPAIAEDRGDNDHRRVAISIAGEPDTKSLPYGEPGEQREQWNYHGAVLEFKETDEGWKLQ